MIVNGQTLYLARPIKNMEGQKITEHGVSHGLGEAGYDIRIKQDILFLPNYGKTCPVDQVRRQEPNGPEEQDYGRFVLASAIEEFDMPDNLCGVVHDKSTWARRGLSVFNTVIEPGWKGFLTLELVYHGQEDLFIPAGAGIAQVVFHHTTHSASYNGKYQNQANRPVEALYEKG